MSAIAAPNELAAQAAADVVAAGGTAVDGAIAGMVVAMSTEPGVVSPLAGGFITVWPTDGEPQVVDGNVEMPGRGLPQERFGEGLREVRTTYGGGLTLYAGMGSAATSGIFAGFEQAHRRWGRSPWPEVLAPAVDALRRGYPLGRAAAGYLAITREVFAWDPGTAALLMHPDGSALPAGHIIVDRALADTLEHLGTAGCADLYTGDLGALLADDMDRRGGLVTAADLSSYRPVLRPALRARVSDWDVATNPPPSIGGPVLLVMFREIVRRGRWTVEDLVDVQRTVLGHRLREHDFSEDLEADGYDLLERVERMGLAGLPTSSSTAHVSVVDRSGMACAITASAGYGSGATVPGTGLMHNNSLGEPELNRLGLHALAPGTRLASNMAPTITRRSTGAVMAVGSPGADRITTALLQVLGRHCLLGVDLAEAIEWPRLHVSFDGSFARPGQTTPVDADRPQPIVQYEDDPELAAAVARLGLPSVAHPTGSMYFGGVGAAYRDADGTFGAAADSRRESATRVG